MQLRTLSFFEERSAITVFGYLSFGPGGKQYPEYFEKWIKTNHGSVDVFVILTDSAFSTDLQEGTPGYTAQLIANRNALSEKYHVKIEVVDIRECQHREFLHYIDWLIAHVSVGKDKKPAYAFISDAARYVGLSMLSECYPNAKRIFLAEADTHGIRKEFLGEDHHSENGFTFFGNDRALMLLRNDDPSGKLILKKFLRVYENLYEFVLKKEPLNLMLSEGLLRALMGYQGPHDDQSRLLTHLQKQGEEYMRWCEHFDENSEKLAFLLIELCGGQSRFLFQSEGIGKYVMNESEQNDFSIHEVEHEEAVSEGKLGFWHDAAANWQGLTVSFEKPDIKYLSSPLMAMSTLNR